MTLRKKILLTGIVTFAGLAFASYVVVHLVMKWYLLLLAFLAAITLGTAKFLILDKMVMSRISDLTKTVVAITYNHDLSARVKISGSDELSLLGNSFNTMLEELQIAHRELLFAQESLQFRATHDEMTEIYNRPAILEILRNESVRCAREGSSIAVMLADLDHFKRVNDAHGHVLGDKVLCAAAKAMTSALRPYDSVGRYGGEEFLIVAPGCDIEGVRKLAERIRLRVNDFGSRVAKDCSNITVSVGVTLAGGDESPETLIALADTALYRAKATGRNRVEIGLSQRSGDSRAHSSVRWPASVTH